MTSALLGMTTPLNPTPVLSMPSCLPASPSTSTALPSARLKNAKSLTQSQCGPGCCGNISTLTGSLGSCAHAPAAHDASAVVISPIPGHFMDTTVAPRNSTRVDYSCIVRKATVLDAAEPEKRRSPDGHSSHRVPISALARGRPAAGGACRVAPAHAGH